MMFQAKALSIIDFHSKMVKNIDCETLLKLALEKHKKRVMKLKEEEVNILLNKEQRTKIYDLITIYGV